METIKVRTLIDITDTGVRRPTQGSQLELNQFRNWSTLLQCIGLRAIIDYDRPPRVVECDVKGLGFGSEYKGKHRVWEFEFRPDRADEFANEHSPVDLLMQDLDLVPIIVDLTETINITQAVFLMNDTKFRNTVVEAN